MAFPEFGVAVVVVFVYDVVVLEVIVVAAVVVVVADIVVAAVSADISGYIVVVFLRILVAILASHFVVVVALAG